MKLLFKFSPLIFAVIFVAGCNKEKPAENPPVPATVSEPPVLKKEIQTLHKAEELDKVVTDNITEQRKQIDDSTQ